MPGRVACAKARQVHGKNRAFTGEGVHIQPPAERASKQSVQKQQRRPRSSPQIMERLAIDFHRLSFSWHVLLSL
jgi:hypothetical protein